MMTFVAVAVGGAVGAALRHAVNLASMRWLGWGFPWGTFIENVLGCFLMGIAVSVFAAKAEIAPEWRALIATGLLGGFTTFSAFAFDTAGLVGGGQIGRAAFYFAGTLILAFAGFYLGAALTRLWLS